MSYQDNTANQPEPTPATGPSEAAPVVNVHGGPAPTQNPAPPVPPRATVAPGPSANRIVAGAFGIAFLLLGALSFTALSDPQFIGDNGQLLFGAFQVNGLLIIARIVLGLVLLLATRDTILGSARTNIGAGVVVLLIAVAAPFIDNAATSGVFALATADYVLFAVGAVVLIAAGVFFDRSRNTDIAP
ncbi:MAG: hypothetical protein CVT64_01805 [Actinobacteria bacterium HGW-Actinobacteria-4]|nr:MAG: hypothetical protein CVT64_01805 [Actinobacteria bacterium HGW-Actinobacteria-4]